MKKTKRPKKKKKSIRKKSVKIGKGLNVTRAAKRRLRKRAGGSNVGEYKGVSKKEFAGPSGGAPKGSFPVNTRKSASAALAYARHAPNPAGIKRAVHKKYPTLGKNKKK